MGSLEKTLEEEKVEDAGSLDESIDRFLDSQHSNLDYIQEWKDPFKLGESENAYLDESDEHMKKAIKYGLAGTGLSIASYAGSAAAFAVNQPEIGISLFAGGSLSHAGGMFALLGEQFRGFSDIGRGMSEFLQNREWKYTEDDMSELLEESEIVISDGVEVRSDDYRQALSRIEKEDQYDSVPLNGVRWKETEDGDFIYKLALAEVSDFGSDKETHEPGDININTISEYVGIVDEESFGENVNPLTMKDFTMFSDLEGYHPAQDKMPGSIQRGIRTVYDKVR